jgi:hypothetical protein
LLTIAEATAPESTSYWLRAMSRFKSFNLSPQVVFDSYIVGSAGLRDWFCLN